ncbi:putative DEAH [Dunaliella salina]|uniref:DEAH n=1 Tax=Dunaliella salina TaxID=3046 RepID=A0ABQ7GSR8_DUNSA|nr:putative DEAH [Dunaliella salina]|eukprot:KAF5837631.1 putative DEAH [Dunaliella salina]
MAQQQGFLKPGERSKKAFGVAFEGNNDPYVHNKKQRTQPPTSHQRRPRDADRLPVAKYRRQLLYLVETHATVVVLGETGSGKTTQIPQFLDEAGWTEGGRMVACTQPRRAAAVTVASRVAEEAGCELGEAVGYAVRFESVMQQGMTRIKFLTDGVLLREMMEDPLLARYSVVMVDEAHERSLATDMLLGLLKKVQRRRPDLRLIVASATLQAEELRAFFDPGRDSSVVKTVQPGPGAPVQRTPAIISIEGRTHPVEVHFLQQPCSNYVVASVETAVDIHKADLPGDILVFLTGQQEVEDAVRMLDREAERLSASSGYGSKLLPLPLYAGLTGTAQAVAFSPAPRGYRKCVVATNIAETSLTLEGVVYVVDSCFVKQRAYNPLLGLEALCVAPVSKASATQRAGRAGRVRPGKAFRLCTAQDFAKLPDTTVPEMQRAELQGMVLQLKALGIDNIMRFEWLAPPPAEAMVRALEALAALGVLDQDARLTQDVGLPLASLSLDPSLGKALLTAFRQSVPCSQEMLTIVAMLTAAPHGPWVAPPGVRKALDEAKSRFAVVEGDLVSLLNVWRAWQEHGCSAQWCAKQLLNQHSLRKAEEVRKQLARACARLGLPEPESCDGDMDHLRKGIVAGLFMNAAVFESTDHNPLAPESDPGTHVYRLIRPVGGADATGVRARSGGRDGMGRAAPGATTGALDAGRLRLRIHSGSVLARCRPEWVVFQTVQQSDSGWYEMQGVTAVQPDMLLEVAPHFFQKSR